MGKTGAVAVAGRGRGGEKQHGQGQWWVVGAGPGCVRAVCSVAIGVRTDGTGQDQAMGLFERGPDRELACQFNNSN